MLIVPVENRPDWKNPPLATLLLILINALVFFVYQAKDPQRLAHAYGSYTASGLAARERQPFLDYLGHSGHAAPQDRQDTVGDDLGDEDDGDEDDGADARQMAHAQFQHAVFDPEFRRTLHRQLDGDPAWRADRARFEGLADAVSSRAFAFNAREARPITWLTSMFLHGSVMHLLGNMVFLFWFGFALEIAIGRGVFLLLYLCSGLGGTLLYWASELGTDHSALGASGAISGVMGMYIALYGLKKINFFYNVIFFSGQVRAPALIVFPLWVGYELWGAQGGADGVGHWAHIGGLLFGFAMLAVWMRVGLKIDRNGVDKIDEDAPFKAAHSRIQDLMVAMKLDAARQAAESLAKAYPRDARSWRIWYGVVKISPSRREYHEVVHSLFKGAGNAARDPALQTLIEEVAHEYVRIGGEAPALTESASLALAPRLGRVEHIKPLAFVVERLLARECRHGAMPGILQATVNLSAKAALTAQASHFREQLQARFPDSAEARQVTAHAPA